MFLNRIDNKSVYLVGAGLSFALSNRMPLTDDLGNRVLDEVWSKLHRRGIRPTFEQGMFESWLSTLAEPQPYLSDVENAYNYADLLQTTQMIYNTIVDCEYSARRDVALWGEKFAYLVLVEQPRIITFNYDTLVDWIVEQYNPVYSTILGFNSLPTPRIIKLHGSIDQFWIPNNTASEPLERDPWSTGDETHVRPPQERIPPGRSPFIVPPVASKSIYYDSSYLRTQWQDAFHILAAADRVVMIGYSLPPADRVANNMLQQALMESDCEVVIVNPSSRSVQTKLTQLGIRTDRITRYERKDCVSDFVEDSFIELQGRLASRWRVSSLPDDFQVFVLDRQRLSSITGARREGDNVILTHADKSPAESSFKWRDIAPLLSMSDKTGPVYLERQDSDNDPKKSILIDSSVKITGAPLLLAYISDDYAIAVSE